MYLLCFPLAFTSSQWEDTLEQCTYPVSYQNFLRGLIIHWFLLEPVFTVMVAKWWFSAPVLPAYMDILCKQELLVLPCSSIHPPTCLLPVWTHGFFLNSIFWTQFFSSVLIKLNYTQFAQIVPDLVSRSSFRLMCSFDTPAIGSASLLWDIRRCPSLI